MILALTVGFFVVLAVAWYHGERGRQHASGAELLIIALLLTIGGALVRHFGSQAAPYRPGAGPGSSASALQRPAAESTPAAAPGAGTPLVAAALPIPAKSVAVLPFENLSNDESNGYFVSGIQGLILAKLGDIGELRVLSHTSTLKYKSRAENVRKVATELGLATILEGSVQKRGSQGLISVQLIDAASDSQLWSETYQRTLDNVFGSRAKRRERSPRRSTPGFHPCSPRAWPRCRPPTPLPTTGSCGRNSRPFWADSTATSRASRPPCRCTGRRSPVTRTSRWRMRGRPSAKARSPGTVAPRVTTGSSPGRHTPMPNIHSSSLQTWPLHMSRPASATTTAGATTRRR